MTEKTTDKGLASRVEGVEVEARVAVIGEIAESRLFDNRTPETVVQDAHDRYGPFVHRVCLFSGGNDSLAVAHRCHSMYDTLIFVDTGTAVPGVREFVQRAADWLEKPLKVYEAAPGEYRRIVLGGDDERGVYKQPLGFPGPMQHTRCYVNLKERAIDAMMRDTKAEFGTSRRDRVLLLTGIRRAESARRRQREDITKRGAKVFCNPLIDWTKRDLNAYRKANDLIESDVAALLHRSGECNCGAFAAPGEREELRSLWPEWFDTTIGSLEREAEAAGLPCHKWGSGREFLKAEAAGPMCSDCELRFDTEMEKA